MRTLLLRRLAAPALASLVTACVSSGSLRTAPLTEGETRIFRGPHALVVTATRQAFSETGLTLDSVLTVDPATTMLLGHSGMSLMSYGEIVRGTVSAEGTQTTVVRVITRSSNSLATTPLHVAGSMFTAIDRILRGWDSSGTAHARIAHDSIDVAAQVTLLRSLAPDRTIRVSGAGLRSMTGEPLSVQDGRLVWADGRPSVPIVAIDTIWVRHGHGSTGALIGGALGLIIGMAVAHQSDTTCPSFDQLGNCLAEGIASGLGTAFIAMGGGAIAGLVVGSSVHSWERRFP